MKTEEGPFSKIQRGVRIAWSSASDLNPDKRKVSWVRIPHPPPCLSLKNLIANLIYGSSG